MLARELLPEEKDSHNKMAIHPLQSWEWGDFRQKSGVAVRRIGTFKDNVLVNTFQVFFHPLPKTSMTIGYIPRGPLPDKLFFSELEKAAVDHNCIFVKLEPNVLVDNPSLLKKLSVEKFSPQALIKKHPGLRLSKKPMFTKYTFQIDLTKSEEDLLAQMNQKTRYNIRLSEKKGVIVQEDNSEAAFETYVNLTAETTKRQKFYAHNKDYHRKMWESLHPSGIARLLTASYQNKTLVAWIVLLLNNILYYPYGASSTKHRELMASNLMMWEAIKWGKKNEAKMFDLWGALSPNPNQKDPFYGFHRFKQGYGGKLVEFIGSYDYVLKPRLYPLYNTAEKLRWAYLKGLTLLWSVPKLW